MLSAGPLYNLSSAIVTAVLGSGPHAVDRGRVGGKVEAGVEKKMEEGAEKKVVETTAEWEQEQEQGQERALRFLQQQYPKVKVEVQTKDTSHFEAITLTMLKQYCDSPSTIARDRAAAQAAATGGDGVGAGAGAGASLVYYFHSKGVTRWRDARLLSSVTDWRRYMEHFLFEREYSY
jgi:hypothetical protein